MQNILEKTDWILKLRNYSPKIRKHNLIFSIVDDFCKLHLKKKKHRGPKYTFSDSQILKMIAIKYLLGARSDRSLVKILSHGIAKSLLGLASRVIGILFSFTLGIYINDSLGRKLLDIKSLLS